MFKSLLKPLQKYNTIIIHRHKNPDGDAIGSQIGLKETLMRTFPDKQVYAVGDVNERYEFIGPVDEIADDLYNDALVIVVDTPEENMISDDRYRSGAFLIKIDHHPPRKKFGDIEIVKKEYESCAGLIADIIFANKFILTLFGARALFTGIVTDSGRFRYSSVSVQTFERVAKLMKYGFDLNDIYNNLYIEDMKIIKLRALFIQKIKLTPDNVAYIKTNANELDEYGIDVFTASRGMVNTMAGIKGVDIWVNFTEDIQNNCVIVEIRSNKHNINQVAVRFGGGGHLNASGAVLPSFKECDEMLAELNVLAKGQS